MQETKGCCGKCKVIPLHAVPPACNCLDVSCTCHNSSDAFKDEMAESMSRLQEVAKKQGANEFKQKVLEAFTRFLGANNEKLITISEVQTIISNLEV